VGIGEGVVGALDEGQQGQLHGEVVFLEFLHHIGHVGVGAGEGAVEVLVIATVPIQVTGDLAIRNVVGEGQALLNDRPDFIGVGWVVLAGWVRVFAGKKDGLALV